jgi:hypothetical protein
MYQFFRGYSQIIARQQSNENLSHLNGTGAALKREIIDVQDALRTVDQRKRILSQIMREIQESLSATESGQYVESLASRFIFDNQTSQAGLSQAEYLNKYCYDYGFTVELAGRYLHDYSKVGAFSNVTFDEANKINLQIFSEVQTHTKGLKDRRDLAILATNLLKSKPHVSNAEFNKREQIVHRCREMVNNYCYVDLAISRSNELVDLSHNIMVYHDVPDDFYLVQRLAISHGYDLAFKEPENLKAYCNKSDPLKSVSSSSMPFDFLLIPPKMLSMAKSERLTGCDLFTGLMVPYDGRQPAIDCLPEHLRQEGNTISENLLKLHIKV